MKSAAYFASLSMIFGSIATQTEASDFSTYFDEKQFCSQASQDQFVYTLLYDILGKQDTGYYLEIGAGEPIDLSNSYFLETMRGWNGVSIDISIGLESRWYAARDNLLLTQDALQSDYRAILQFFPKVIDYLSLDIDGYYDQVLDKIPFDNYTFKVITIEHDFYRYGDYFRKKEREMLTAEGYYLLCPNVSIGPNAFEDWWIHPSAFPPETFSLLTSLDLEEKNHTHLLQTLRSAFGL